MCLFLESRWKYEWPIYDSMTHRLTHASSINGGHFSRAFLCPDMLIQQFLRLCVDTNMGKIGSEMKRTAVGNIFIKKIFNGCRRLQFVLWLVHHAGILQLRPLLPNSKAIFRDQSSFKITTMSVTGIIHVPRIILLIQQTNARDLLGKL